MKFSDFNPIKVFKSGPGDQFFLHLFLVNYIQKSTPKYPKGRFSLSFFLWSSLFSQKGFRTTPWYETFHGLLTHKNIMSPPKNILRNPPSPCTMQFLLDKGGFLLILWGTEGQYQACVDMRSEDPRLERKSGSYPVSCPSQLVLRLRWPATMGCNFRHRSLTSSENINIFFVKGGLAWAFIEHCDRVEYTK